MVYWDEQGNTVEISKADQLWLDDGYFKTQQAHLPPDAPRAALSYRVSTKGQVDHNDIPMQKIKCRKFAQQQGWRVVMEKAEKGISGSKVSASKRDVIQELRQEAGNGSFDILLVYLYIPRIQSFCPADPYQCIDQKAIHTNFRHFVHHNFHTKSVTFH